MTSHLFIFFTIYFCISYLYLIIVIIVFYVLYVLLNFILRSFCLKNTLYWNYRELQNIKSISWQTVIKMRKEENTNLYGGVSASFWGVVFSRNSSCRTPFTLIAETQTSSLRLLHYDEVGVRGLSVPTHNPHSIIHEPSCVELVQRFCKQI